MIGGHDVEIIALIAQKGGVGKSTSAHSIGAGMAQAGRKVLMVDLDPQCSLSSIAGISTQGLSILDVIQRKASAGQAVQHCSRYDVIAGSEALAADGILSGKGREYRLRDATCDISGSSSPESSSRAGTAASFRELILRTSTVSNLPSRYACTL